MIESHNIQLIKEIVLSFRLSCTFSVEKSIACMHFLHYKIIKKGVQRKRKLQIT